MIHDNSTKEEGNNTTEEKLTWASSDDGVKCHSRAKPLAMSSTRTPPQQFTQITRLTVAKYPRRF